MGVFANEWFYLALMLWLKMTGLLSETLFFSFAGDYFTTHAARRVYVYITGGMALGSVLAGLLIGRIVQVVGTENLLYGGLAILITTMGLTFFIYRVGIPCKSVKACCIGRQRHQPQDLTQDHPEQRVSGNCSS